MIIFFIVFSFAISFLWFYVGRKYQYDKEKELFNKAKNDQQLLDYIYNHFKLNVKQ